VRLTNCNSDGIIDYHAHGLSKKTKHVYILVNSFSPAFENEQDKANSSSLNYRTCSCFWPKVFHNLDVLFTPDPNPTEPNPTRPSSTITMVRPKQQPKAALSASRETQTAASPIPANETEVDPVPNSADVAPSVPPSTRKRKAPSTRAPRPKKTPVAQQSANTNISEPSTNVDVEYRDDGNENPPQEEERHEVDIVYSNEVGQQ
jgi:hypothetical protein